MSQGSQKLILHTIQTEWHLLVVVCFLFSSKCKKHYEISRSNSRSFIKLIFKVINLLLAKAMQIKPSKRDEL